MLISVRKTYKTVTVGGAVALVLVRKSHSLCKTCVSSHQPGIVSAKILRTQLVADWSNFEDTQFDQSAYELEILEIQNTTLHYFQDFTNTISILRIPPDLFGF